MLDDLKAKNRAWAARKVAADAGFFRRLVNQQAPEYLWIGCSDSRVPANQISGLEPGEVFVHRNISNVVVPTDLNCLSVVQYAVDQLKVAHLMVVGHYGCGGVLAALQNLRIGLADNWIRHVQDVRDKHQALLEKTPVQWRHDVLCELNAIEQVVNVAHSTVIQDAWARGQKLELHAWCYGLKDGLITNLEMSIPREEGLQAAYERAVALVASRERY